MNLNLGDRIGIVNGPSKSHIMTALFAEDDQSSELEFTLDRSLPDPRGTQEKLRIALASVEREDETGHSWNITGFVQSGPFDQFTRVYIYYNSERRRGGVKPIIR